MPMQLHDRVLLAGEVTELEPLQQPGTVRVSVVTGIEPGEGTRSMIVKDDAVVTVANAERERAFATNAERERVLRVLAHHDKKALAGIGGSYVGSVPCLPSLAIRAAAAEVRSGKDYPVGG